MYVLLKADVEKVGIQGSIVKVSDGYATNFLIPKKLGIVVQESELKLHEARQKKAVVAKEVLNSKLGMLAERIKALKLTIKKRSHDDGKLYGSINAEDIVAVLKEKDVKIDKKQVEFDKTIRTTGDYTVTIKLTTKIAAPCRIHVTGE